MPGLDDKAEDWLDKNKAKQRKHMCRAQTTLWQEKCRSCHQSPDLQQLCAICLSCADFWQDMCMLRYSGTAKQHYININDKQLVVAEMERLKNFFMNTYNIMIWWINSEDHFVQSGTWCWKQTSEFNRHPLQILERNLVRKPVARTSLLTLPFTNFKPYLTFGSC